MAGVDVGTAYLTVVPSAKGFAGKLQSELGGGMDAAGSKAGDKASKSFGSKFKAGIGTAAKAGALALVGAMAVGVAAASKAVNAASELQQSTGGVEAVFGKNAAGIKKSAAEAAQGLGLSKNSYQELAAALGAGLKNKGLKNYAAQSQTLIGVGADLAAQFGGSTQDAVEALSSALRGEYDPIERYGVALNQTAIQAEAMRLGLVKSTVDAGKVSAAQLRAEVAQRNYNKALKEHGKDSSQAKSAQAGLTSAQGALKKALSGTKGELSDTAKAQAALSLITRQTKDAQGAFGRESDTLAGQQARLKATYENIQATVGTKLLPVMTKVASAVNTFIMEMQNGTGKGGAFVSFLKDAGSKLQAVAGFVSRNSDVIVPLVGALAAGAAVFKIITLATRAWAAAQVLLNLVLTANPIGIVIVAIAALVTGLVIAYKKSETFRDIVNNVWDTVKTGALLMALGIVKYFHFMVNAWLTVVGVIITAAAKAFGWVPGLGPKLKAAAEKVHGFKDSANAALSKVEKNLQLQVDVSKADAKINDFRRRQSKAIKVFFDVTTRQTGRITVNGVATNAGKRAHGGPVSAGSPYWVGDNKDGSLNRTSELFVPKTSGTVFNQDQLATMGGQGRGGGTTHIHVMLDGDQVAEVVMDRFGNVISGGRTMVGTS